MHLTGVEPAIPRLKVWCLNQLGHKCFLFLYIIYYILIYNTQYTYLQKVFCWSYRWSIWLYIILNILICKKFFDLIFFNIITYYHHWIMFHFNNYRFLNVKSNENDDDQNSKNYGEIFFSYHIRYEK